MGKFATKASYRLYMPFHYYFSEKFRPGLEGKSLTQALSDPSSDGIFINLPTYRACEDICPRMLCRIIKSYDGIEMLKQMFQDYITFTQEDSSHYLPFYSRSDLFTMAINCLRDKPTEDAVEELLKSIRRHSGMILIIPPSHPAHQGVRPTTKYCLNPTLLKDALSLCDTQFRFPQSCPTGSNERVFQFLNYLATVGSATLIELETHFELSSDTINRTINHMHEQGIILKRKDLKPLRVVLNLAHFLINDLSISFP
ncbi:MAG: DeoR family transcriptional regulator [Candidatus Hodarchaeales archaeon]|jgi:hypothetical protein